METKAVSQIGQVKLPYKEGWRQQSWEVNLPSHDANGMVWASEEEDCMRLNRTPFVGSLDSGITPQ
jgi:hypothetical protein